ncbi:MAG: D-alanyl-D-alanine carboxypeptidase [Clostridia bacterium]|nr:D-alanyl-D-alanine carboxypeptidase [Clostridia bacterium]
MKRIFTLLTAISICLCFTLSVCGAGQPEGSAAIAVSASVSAESAILIDADSGEVFCEKNADAPMGMASTTKLMTALTALRLGEPDRRISIPAEAVGVEGSSVYLIEGEVLTLEELLYALLLSSANDAAVAIAVSLSGSISAFAEEMNAYAAELGLKSTHFTNPHGLYDEEHYTTARELAVISAEALRSELISEIVSAQKTTIPHDGVADKRLLVNHNKMLKSYDGAIGMKTGFTKKTGRCLVSAARRDGLTLIAVTLNAPDDWRDHTALLDYGFENYERRIFYTAGAFSYALPLSDGESESVILTNTEPLALTVRKGASDVEIRVEAPFRFAVGDTKKGDLFGSVTLSVDGAYCTSVLAFSESSSGKTRPKKGFFERIFTFFSTEDIHGKN